VLFCCENNRYAMGTAIERAHAETDLALRAASYRMPAWPVDGMDALAVADAARRAAEAVRAGEGPHFLELLTYRFRAHSMFDPELYRAKEEVEAWKRRCPIALLTARLRADGTLDDATLARIEEEALAEVDTAVAFAEAGTWEPVEALTRFVRSEGTEP
jgi:pyruvate dehydrogenase E1 component alpha subunit